MNSILTLLALTLPAFAQGAQELMADFASCLGKEAAQAAPLKMTKSKNGTYLEGGRDGWSWTLRPENGKIAQGCVELIPKSPPDLASAAAAFGFSKEKGWTVGQPFKRGLLECVFLTHKERGIFLLKATPGDPPKKFSVLNFFPPEN